LPKKTLNLNYIPDSNNATKALNVIYIN